MARKWSAADSEFPCAELAIDIRPDCAFLSIMFSASYSLPGYKHIGLEEQV